MGNTESLQAEISSDVRKRIGENVTNLEQINNLRETSRIIYADFPKEKWCEDFNTENRKRCIDDYGGEIYRRESSVCIACGVNNLQ